MRQSGTRLRGIAPRHGWALHTIGYEGIGIERFLQALHAHAIEVVVDVRELPQSRKPGFAKKALAAHLAKQAVRYVHIAALGCPRVIRHRYRNDDDWGRYERAFRHYLAQQDEALAALGALAVRSNCALMCFEADAHYCHRRMVAAAVARAQRTPVLHINTHQTSAGE
jgi:uncharacterized protein (DUF488 family)